MKKPPKIIKKYLIISIIALDCFLTTESHKTFAKKRTKTLTVVKRADKNKCITSPQLRHVLPLPLATMLIIPQLVLETIADKKALNPYKKN